MLAVYRFFFPLVFLFFIPGLIWKLIRRGGWKKTYSERIALFSRERLKELESFRGAVWIHAVSVGETNLALTILKKRIETSPGTKYILSTTTTTGQAIAREHAPEGVKVIFCPIDFSLFVGRVLDLLQPSALVILETELWPNLILMAKQRGVKLLLLNTRISDKSFRGYRRFRRFFAPLLNAFDHLCVQTELDRKRLLEIAPGTDGKITVCGNIKFDQTPSGKEGFDFSQVFGNSSPHLVITAASTHSPEEKLILDAFQSVRQKHPEARLVLVPRHAERGGELENLLREKTSLNYLRRSRHAGPAAEGENVDCLLADTTGELASFLKSSDIVIMGKTLAGNHEGQNIIEPAAMGKPVICGPELKNFRQALNILRKHEAVLRIRKDEELPGALETLLSDSSFREQLGTRAGEAIAENRGALKKTLEILEASL